MKLTERQLQRILHDKHYWMEIASGIIAEGAQNAQNVPRGADSAIAPPAASLGRILETQLQQDSTRVRISTQGAGPRMIPQIVEVKTIDPEKGVLLSQGQARRVRRQWDKGRLHAQQQIQDGESGQVGMDHPNLSCDQAHPNTSHDEFVIASHSEEEEEGEEYRNPLYRDRRNTFDTSRRRER